MLINSLNKRFIISALGLFFIFIPVLAMAAGYQYDLGLVKQDTWFSKESFSAGEKLKVYTQVHNYGQENLSAYVIFYQDEQVIGEPQPVAVAASESAIVNVNWIAKQGECQMNIRLVGVTPRDDNPTNNQLIVSLQVAADNDGDGLSDDLDLDDDNDNLSDVVEADMGTDSFNPDTDGDGIIDSQDKYPLDNQRREIKPIADNIDNNNQPVADTVSLVEFFDQPADTAVAVNNDRQLIQGLEIEKLNKYYQHNKNGLLVVIFIIGLLVYFLPRIIKWIRKRKLKRKD